MVNNLKVALVHDDLVQWGGAERMLAALCEVFPQAPIYTSVFDSKNSLLKQKFASKKVYTSFLQNIPGWKSFYRALLPLYPLAFEQFDFSEFDLVISQTTRFAKTILTKPGTRHICYCHTPPRFLWNFSGEKVSAILKPYFDFLRRYDLVSSHRVDQWVAGSKNAQNRIKQVYNQDSEVIYPFVEMERFKDIEIFDGGYLLVISRLNRYKRIDLIIKAASKLEIPLKIIGVGPDMVNLQQIAGPTVEFLGMINDELLNRVLGGCKALVVAAEEDFGLTPLEAQALGKPVIAYGKGGALETVIDGKTGYLFNNQSVEEIINALDKLDKQGYNKTWCVKQAAGFSKERFSSGFKGLIDK